VLCWSSDGRSTVSALSSGGALIRIAGHIYTVKLALHVWKRMNALGQVASTIDIVGSSSALIRISGRFSTVKLTLHVRQRLAVLIEAPSTIGTVGLDGTLVGIFSHSCPANMALRVDGRLVVFETTTTDSRSKEARAIDATADTVAGHPKRRRTHGRAHVPVVREIEAIIDARRWCVRDFLALEVYRPRLEHVKKIGRGPGKGQSGWPGMAMVFTNDGTRFPPSPSPQEVSRL
jgi:hypothetical protein